MEFAVEGKVKAHIHQQPLEGINAVFAGLKAGRADGRIAVPL
jgi:propanol-preferring alcohol dehydrogenase